MKKGKRFDLETPEGIRDLSKRVHASYRAITKDFNVENAEDIAADVMARYVEGKSQHQLVDHTVLDLVRSQKGSRRGSTEKYYHSKKSIVGATPVGNDLWKYDKRSVEPEALKNLEFESTKEILEALPDKKMRMIAKLSFIWGLQMKEISDLFEVTETRVSQIIKSIKEKIALKLKQKEKQYESYLNSQRS